MRDDIQTIWKHIDSYCHCFKLSDDVAVVLSLLVLNLDGVRPNEVKDICNQFDLREHHILKLVSIICGNSKKNILFRKPTNNFPCMLIIDQVSSVNVNINIKQLLFLKNCLFLVLGPFLLGRIKSWTRILSA